MTNNYGPNSTPGEIRQRLWRIGGENPNALANPGQLPTMIFHEEEAIKLSTPDVDGSTEKSLGRTRDIPMTFDPGRLVQLRNPLDDSPLGSTMTVAQIFAILYSLGRQVQTDDDARIAAEAAAKAAAGG